MTHAVATTMTMLPSAIPIFPLPNVVLFPNVFLPLHIFEPRYRQMVSEALQGDRIIGMVLLRPGWEANYEGRPAVYPVGCAGLITHAEPLSDGRYNIVLRGLEKFRVLDDDDSRGYRVARIETMTEDLNDEERASIRVERRRLEALLVPQPEGRGADAKVPPSMADEDLVNALAQYLELEPVEKQALLERDGLLARCRSLIELLEMKVIVSQHKWQGIHSGFSPFQSAFINALGAPPPSALARRHCASLGPQALFLLLSSFFQGSVLDRHVADERHGSARSGGLAAGGGDGFEDFPEQTDLNHTLWGRITTCSRPIGATAFTPPGPAPPEIRSYKSAAVRNSVWTAPRSSNSPFIVSTPTTAVYWHTLRPARISSSE